MSNNHDIIADKLERLTVLSREISIWSLAISQGTVDNLPLVRACERNLEIMIELASDINAMIALEQRTRTPDSYKGSFRILSQLGIIDNDLCEKLIDSVELRNIIVHEYDFEADTDQFIDSLTNTILPAYSLYIERILISIHDSQ